jgi:Zn-dependent protease with chaperone function
MNFFEQQVRARRASRWLLLLFLGAVVSLLAMTHVAILLVLNFLSDDYHRINWSFQHTGIWQIYISLGMLVLIALAILYKWRQLQPGGHVMAEALGCQRVLPQTASMQEKQLINVVEEMALASGLPVPSIYCLPSDSINAFAAGFTSADAVIGVTQGALTHLARDELQAVIAHEFSHIINGDMRLNAQLLALLFGIEFIGLTGLVLCDGSSSRRYRSIDASTGYRSGWYLSMLGANRSHRSKNGLALLGVMFIVIGYLGGLFAKAIKAAINRQREYLADAAAVQFTRYADGLANALLKVGSQGSAIDHPQAQVMGHFFFSNAESPLFSWNPLATHPSLAQRLSKIKPQWTQGLLKFKTRASRQSPVSAVAAESNIAAFDSISPDLPDILCRPNLNPELPNVQQFVDVEQPAAHVPQQLTVSDEWRQRVHEPYEACLLIYALAFAQQHDKAAQRCRLLLQIQYARVQSLHTQLALLTEDQRWQLLSMAMPSIKALSKAQYVSFKKTLRALIQIDQRIDLLEWSLFELVTHVGDAQFIPRAIAKPLYQQMESFLDEYVYVLKLLIQHLHADAENSEKRMIFLNALNAIGIQQPISWQSAQWQWQTFHAAQQKLALAYPLLKARLIKGWLYAAQPIEHSNPQPIKTQQSMLISQLPAPAQHLLTALAACLDVPFLLMETIDY